MIEALVRVLLDIVALPLVQGLGYVVLRGLRLQRAPTEAACTMAGLLGWCGIAWGVLAALGKV